VGERPDYAEAASPEARAALGHREPHHVEHGSARVLVPMLDRHPDRRKEGGGEQAAGRR